MLFAVIYTERNPTEESQKRSLKLFTSWTPPAGLTFKAHYASTEGGIAIVEAESAAAVLEGIGPFTPFFDFKALPVVDMMEAVPIFQRLNAWRDSVR